jgi:hypothetical protein
MSAHLYTFRCDGFRAVQAENAGAAAEIFAEREAHRKFGKRGFCRTLRLDSWSHSKKTHTYEAFICVPVRADRYVTGHNTWLTVARVGEEEN